MKNYSFNLLPKASNVCRGFLRPSGCRAQSSLPRPDRDRRRRRRVVREVDGNGRKQFDETGR